MSDNKPTDNHRKTLKEGSPEERVKAWLQLTLNESGHSKQGDWMNTLIPHLELVSTNAEGPHPSCVFSYTVQPDNCNRLQNLHGGCAATLFDWCTTLPLALVNKPGFWQHMGVSRTLNVTYMRPVPVGTEVLIECSITQVGKKLASLHGNMRRRSDNLLLATAEHGGDPTQAPHVKSDAMYTAGSNVRSLSISSLHGSLISKIHVLSKTTQLSHKIIRIMDSLNAVAPILQLPAEILHHILQWIAPADLVILPRVCKAFHTVTKVNYKLYRDVYMNTLDEPSNSNLDYEQEIRDFVKLEITRILKNASPSHDEAINLSKTHAPSRNVAHLQSLFSRDDTAEAFLQGSSLFNRLRRQPTRDSISAPTSCDDGYRTLQQKSAHLHCLYSRPILNVGRLRSMKTYPYACSKVYDLRQFTQNTGWGPFKDDGTFNVDWEKVEAILIVLGHNIGARRLIARIFAEVWDSPFSGSFQNSFMAPPPRDITSLEARDPYGVTGTCDFFAFNFGDPELITADAPRPPLDVGEATRIIMMKVNVTSIEEPAPEDGQELPVVHFRGVSRSLDDSFDDNANSNIRAGVNVRTFNVKGTARLTKEGEVRWTTFSIFHGVERWRSEGIQIGGVRSARGVVGNWFDSDYDVHGPAGPTAFWKGATLAQVANMEDDLLPNDFFLPYGALIDIDIDSETDPEGEMPYTGEDDEDEDDEDEEMEGTAAGEELTALLHDANLPLEESLANGHALN
ncbi:uncharacterized protein BKA55DRAFT_594856 [Fusarium redolens]|uniref:F-box domain-containing protein n=1 Tax=Fusarium redolens TaxID=48865 RepID=A0A9P9H1P6_FUSRE|nr:uncharacterized protein BKA55DRAFT_594856 [Fusarium redolens]KAH7249036.1 hypothetical protein BKA55DRAFT_594856 [Fusarium redolens]